MPMITRRLASLISFLFSPFVVPIVAILFLVRVYAQTWEQLMLWTTITVLFITIIPFIYIYLKVKQGKLPDLHIVTRGQRIVPLLFTQLSAIIGVFILYILTAPKGVIDLGICYIVNGIVFILITQFWKISLHSAVVAGYGFA